MFEYHSCGNISHSNLIHPLEDYLADSKKCAEEEPLYDSVASDEDYAIAEEIVNICKINLIYAYKIANKKHIPYQCYPPFQVRRIK